MDGYFEIGIGFLDGYFLNEPVLWMGWFLNYQFFGWVPNFFSCQISNLDRQKLCEKSALVMISQVVRLFVLKFGVHVYQQVRLKILWLHTSKKLPYLCNPPCIREMLF